MRRVAATAMLAALSAVAPAQTLIDPMRPPAPAVQPRTADGNAAAPALPVVQTIIIGPTQRLAILDGRTVVEGDRIGEARVARITGSDVTLRDPSGRTTVLELLPRIRKQPSAPVPAASIQAVPKERKQ